MQTKFIEEYRKLKKIAKTNHAANYYEGQKSRFVKLFKLVSPYTNKNEKGLDIGIYPGYFTYCLKKMGYDICAIDIHPKRVPEQIKKELLIKECDIETQRIPYPNNTFDYVLFTAILEHLRTNPLFTLREIKRVLKPHGKLILQTPNLGYWYCRLAVFFGRGFDHSPYTAYNLLEKLGHSGHIRVYTMKELIEMLEKTGFEIKLRKWTNIFRKNLPKNHTDLPKSIFKSIIDYIFGIYPPLRKQLFVIAGKK